MHANTKFIVDKTHYSLAGFKDDNLANVQSHMYVIEYSHIAPSAVFFLIFLSFEIFLNKSHVIELWTVYIYDEELLNFVDLLHTSVWKFILISIQEYIHELKRGIFRVFLPIKIQLLNSQCCLHLLITIVNLYDFEF